MSAASSNAKGNRTAFITGLNGYIASHLGLRLANLGWNVHGTLREGRDFRPRPHGNPITVHRIDRTTEKLVVALKAAQPDVVFHLASLFIAEHRTQDIPALIDSNVSFGTQLLEAMSLAGAHRIVNTGTAWQNYEDDNYNPVSLYAATKEAFCDILRFYVQTRNFRAITLKLFDTYGPHDSRQKLIPALINAAKNGGPPLRMSPGEQYIDLVFIDDVVEGFVAAGERLLANGVPEEVFAVKSGNPASLRALVATASRVFNTPIPVEWGARQYRAREMMKPWRVADPVPGWAPSVSLEEGLRLSFAAATTVNPI